MDEKQNEVGVSDYSPKEISAALKKVGLSKGDCIFIHSNLGFFGKLKNASSKEDYYSIFKKAIFEIIGKEGTVVVPTFSYSFCWGKEFDPDNTPGVCGFFSEMVRKDTESTRSEDANFSVAAIGKYAQYFTENAPEHSFGKDCFWERFLEKKGKICNFNFDAGSTFVHYVEKTLCVNYRYDKKFVGRFIKNSISCDKEFFHFVYDLNKPTNNAEFTKLDKKARELGLVKTANLGRGQILLISSVDTFSLIKNELEKNPAFLIMGDKVT